METGLSARKTAQALPPRKSAGCLAHLTTIETGGQRHRGMGTPTCLAGLTTLIRPARYDPQNEGSLAVPESPEVAFRRVCQVAAISESSRLEGTLDWLVQVLMYYYDGPWRSADDWFDAIQDTFSLELSLHDISQSVARLSSNRHLVLDSYRGEYKLSDPARSAVESRLEEAAQLEGRVERHWLESVEELITPDRSGLAWGILLEYAASVFRLHGAEAIDLLSKQVDDEPMPDGGNTKQLIDILKREKFDESDFPILMQAVSEFFSSTDTETLEYIVQLADSTFNLMALTIDDETREELKSKLPALKIFVDTNVLFSLLGTHDTPLAAATIDLFNVIKRNDLPFKLYCHSKTADELTYTLEAKIHVLTSRPWSQQVSRTLASLPWHVTRLSGIEMRFHQLNAARPTSPSVFAARFASPMALLSEFGVHVFREPDVSETAERMELRATIADQYKEYLQKNPRRRKASYERLDHDARLWIISKHHQSPSRKGTLFSGSFFLSSDLQLWRFDRQVLRKEYSSKPVVVLPDALLQALRPFVGASSAFDNAAFAKLFSAAEFRGADTESHTDTLQRVAAYIASFADLSEETARRILTDSMLLRRIGQADESSEAFQDPIRDAIVEYNEMLISQRDELLVEREAGLDLVQEALKQATSNGMIDKNVQNILEQLAERFSSDRKPSVNKVIIGNVFENNNSEIVAQGPGVGVYDSTISQQLLSVDMADPAVITELARIRAKLLDAATTGEDYDAIAGVQSAIEAAERKDEPSFIAFLKKAGSKAIEVGVDIGTKVAVKALESAAGISS
jgi:hypothetical protein